MLFQFPPVFACVTAYCIPCTLQPHRTLLADHCIQSNVHIFNLTKHIIWIHIMTGDIVFRVLDMWSASLMWLERQTKNKGMTSHWPCCHRNSGIFIYKITAYNISQCFTSIMTKIKMPSDRNELIFVITMTTMKVQEFSSKWQRWPLKLTNFRLRDKNYDKMW